MAGPYELQSPKDIAMEYGGNKQKIAQAAQMGMIDPTSAVLAGMFIDKMRMAQQEEMAPQSTVAQDVMAAPQMAAGLGATPQAAMAPTEAGVAALPVPDEMVPNEFAGGGIVAFANGGMPIDEEVEAYRPRGLGSMFGLLPQGIGSGNVDYQLMQLGYPREQITSMDPAMKRYIVANATAPAALTTPTAPTAATPVAPASPAAVAAVAAPAPVVPRAAAATQTDPLSGFAEYQAMLRAAGVPEDPFAEDREAMKARQKELAAQGKEDQALALIGAGLAGMNTRNLAEFAQKAGEVGFGMYGKSKKEAREEQREIDKMNRDTRKAEVALKRGDVEKYMDFKDKAEARRIQMMGVEAQRAAAGKPGGQTELIAAYAKAKNIPFDQALREVATAQAEGKDPLLAQLQARAAKGETSVDIRDLLKRNPYLEPTR